MFYCKYTLTRGASVRIPNKLLCQVFLRQKRIGEEVKAVRQLGARLITQSKRWTGAVFACDTAIRELGDFENYLSVLRDEVAVVAAALEAAAARKRQQAADAKSDT